VSDRHRAFIERLAWFASTSRSTWRMRATFFRRGLRTKFRWQRSAFCLRIPPASLR